MKGASCGVFATIPDGNYDQINVDALAGSLLTSPSVGVLVMRNTATAAASPCFLRWQAAFTTVYAAQPVPPVTWQRLSAAEMAEAKWSDAVFLTWARADSAKS
jgi:hypothetical protein